MLYLLGSIILTSYLAFSFKVVERLHINSLQATFSAVVAWMAFKEKPTFLNWMGIGLSLIAIALIAFT